MWNTQFGKWNEIIVLHTKNAAMSTLVSQFCHFLNCGVVVLLWGGASAAKYLLENAVLSLYALLRGRFSSVHPLVRFVPWWGLCASSSCCVQCSSSALSLVCFRVMSLHFLTQCSAVPQRQHWRMPADKLAVNRLPNNNLAQIITFPSNTPRDVVCSAVISWNVICWWDIIVPF